MERPGVIQALLGPSGPMRGHTRRRQCDAGQAIRSPLPAGGEGRCRTAQVQAAGRGGRRDALEVKGPQRRPQKRLDRRLEEVAKAVGGGYCRLQVPLSMALAVSGWA